MLEPRRARKSLAVPNGSPFEAGKEDVRLKLAAARVSETGLPLIYLNQVGGQDEVVFDGASLCAQCRSLAGAGAAVAGANKWSSPNGSAMRTANGCARRARRSGEESRDSRRSITP